jgi:DNA-binding NtrC family response regulator
MSIQVDIISPRLAVCVISNDHSMVAMLRLMFVAMGFASPESFVEAQAAWPRVCEDIPDLILCDCRNGAVSARQLIGRLRANPGTAEVPVIAITGENSESLWLEAINAGASEFLFSPFNVSDLYGAMEMALISSQRETPESVMRRWRA